MKTVDSSLTRSLLQARPLSSSDDKQPEVVLCAWALGEIEHKLDSLELQLDATRRSRHPLQHLRLRRQIVDLRHQYGEQRAEIDLLRDAN